MTRLVLAITLLGAACAPVVTTASGQRFETYQYVLEVPVKPVSPNERLKLAWKPQLASQPSSALFEIQLCVALFGPWESVEALKKAAQPDTRACPPVGAVATSETARVASNNGQPLAAIVTVPSAPGFYDLRQISIYGAGNSMSAGSVIEVR